MNINRYFTKNIKIKNECYLIGWLTCMPKVNFMRKLTTQTLLGLAVGHGKTKNIRGVPMKITKLRPLPFI